jgi:flagellar hook protein FlgE
MSRAMNTAITAMKANQTKLDVISNNIANSSSGPTANTGGTNAKEVGLGSNVSSIDKLMSQGNAESTGRTLDNMIDGDGYFIVTKGSIDQQVTVTNNALTGADAAGTTAEIDYTRDGNFSLDKDGNLVTSDGYRVMGYYALNVKNSSTGIAVGSSGSGIVSADDKTQAFANGELTPLSIPSEVYVGTGTTPQQVSGFSIGSDGIVSVQTSTGTYAIGQVAMANFTNPEGLEDQGNNYLKESSNSGQAVIMDSKTPASTTSNNSSTFGKIRSGYLEASNVDLTTEFANMITTSKSFQAASKMITNESEMLDTVIGLIR